jgi:hypothetical protein
LRCDEQVLCNAFPVRARIYADLGYRYLGRCKR